MERLPPMAAEMRAVPRAEADSGEREESGAAVVATWPASRVKRKYPFCANIGLPSFARRETRPCAQSAREIEYCFVEPLNIIANFHEDNVTGQGSL